MFNRSISRWLVGCVFVGVLLGILIGGAGGGIAVYYQLLQSGAANGNTTGAQDVLVLPSFPRGVQSSLLPVDDGVISGMVKKAAPAVVTILSTVQLQGRRNGTGSALAEGSGVIIDARGHILTNNHVVEGAREIQIILNDGRATTAKLVGADAQADIALLLLVGDVPAFVTLGHSSALQLGDTVVAIGNPLGNYRGSVTVGVVSGLDRTVAGTEQTGLIQTDAAINHGNSGGPLLNLAGEVVGINTLVDRQEDDGDPMQGLGFAIPSDVIAKIVSRLLSKASLTAF